MAKLKVNLIILLMGMAIVLFHYTCAEITASSKFRLGKCHFYDAEESTNVTVSFRSSYYKCVSCGTENHIKPKNVTQDFCSFHCNGLKCALGTKCKHFGDINGLASCGEGKFGLFEKHSSTTVAQDAPVIIGFTTGGILLLIIVVGIIVTRRSSSNGDRFSEVATTPMSCDNSEEYGGKSYHCQSTSSNRVEEIKHSYQNGNTNYRVPTDFEYPFTTADAFSSDWHQQHLYEKEVCNYEGSPLAEGTDMMIEDQDLMEGTPESDPFIHYSIDDNSNYRDGKYVGKMLESDWSTNEKYSQPMDCQFSPMATVIDQQYWSKNDNSRPRCFSAMEHAYPLHYDAHSTVAYRTKNLTYVVVDVHKNSQLSTEDLCGDRNSSIAEGNTSDFSSLGKNAMRKIFRSNPFPPEQLRLVDCLSLSPRRSPSPTASMETAELFMKQRITSSLLSDRGYRTCPRQMRLSSAGSGEYALPYDAIA